MKPNLLYATTVNLYDKSAQSIQIHQMSIAFSRVFEGQFELYAFENENENYKSRKEYSSVFLSSKGGKLIRTILIIYRILCANTSNYHVFTRDIFIALFFTLCGKHTVWEAHQATSYRSKIVLKFLNKFGKFRVLTISKALKYSKEIPIESNKVFSYHDGVSLSDIYNNHVKGVTFPNTKTALYTGALHKGEDIESLSPLFAVFKKWDFIFIGGKEQEVRQYKKLYYKYKNVKFMGRVDREKVKQYQISSSVLLFPLTTSNHLWRYTSPLKLFEYMASGRPIIGSSIGSAAEIISSENAYVYNNSDEIVTSFQSFVDADKSELKAKACQNIYLIKTIYNWERRASFIKDNLFK